MSLDEQRYHKLGEAKKLLNTQSDTVSTSIAAAAESLKAALSAVDKIHFGVAEKLREAGGVTPARTELITTALAVRGFLEASAKELGNAKDRFGHLQGDATKAIDAATSR